MTKSVGARDYTPTEVDAALTTLAYYGGNAARAAAELGIPHSTLKLWRAHSHRDRYLEIAEREGPRLEQIAAQQAREVILRAGEAEHSLLDILNARMADESAPEPQRDDFPNETLYLLAYEQWLKRGSSKELSELAGTLQRVTTAKGINGTKLLELTGRPTQIVEHRDPKQAAQALARRLGVTIESTATEIPAAQPPKTSQTPLLSESGSANVREADPAA
jgi:hypothetical protein